MFRFKFNVTILVLSHCGKCWWTFSEIISVCAAQKCINIPEMSVFWTIGSLQVRILTVTNLMPPSHFHIWRARKTKTRSNCLHTDPHILNSSQMLTHLRILWSLSANERTVLKLLTNQKPANWPRSYRVWGSASLGTLRVLSKTKYLEVRWSSIEQRRDPRDNETLGKNPGLQL